MFAAFSITLLPSTQRHSSSRCMSELRGTLQASWKTGLALHSLRVVFFFFSDKQKIPV